MRLEVDFSLLFEEVKRIGADNFPVDPVDAALLDGIEGDDLGEIGITGPNRLLHYKGRQILVYIRDHGPRAQSAFEDGSRGNKFHIVDCRTLQEMKEKGRYKRYVRTNSTSSSFRITGYDDEAGELLDGQAKLRVCKNCLIILNYRGYRDNSDCRTRIFADFDLKEFFDTYRSRFQDIPKRLADSGNDGYYSGDWREISAWVKRMKHFTCESCHLNLEQDKRLLHTHHIDGVKSNEQLSNLKVLCADCHRQQPGHERMHASPEDIRRIRELRRKQGLPPHG